MQKWTLRRFSEAMVAIAWASGPWAPSGSASTRSASECEIMIYVTHGRLNKQIAHDIGIAESHGEGASHQLDAKDEGPFASRAQPNGGHPQAHARTAATLLNQASEVSRPIEKALPPFAKPTDSQLLVLSAAAQRNDRCLVAAPKVKALPRKRSLAN